MCILIGNVEISRFFLLHSLCIFKWPGHSNDLKKFKQKLHANPGFLCSPRLRLVKGGLRSIVEVVQVWIQMLHLTSQIDELLRDTVFREKTKPQATQDEHLKSNRKMLIQKTVGWGDINFESQPIVVTLVRHKWPGLQVPHTEGLYSAALIDLHLKVLWRKSFGAKKMTSKFKNPTNLRLKRWCLLVFATHGDANLQSFKLWLRFFRIKGI